MKSSKKKVTNNIPKETDLNEEEALIGSYVMQLNDKYECSVKNHKHCYIQGDRHLSLSNFAISIWAREIVSYFLINYNYFLIN